MVKEKGTLYWITGLAGAGKTTIGTCLYYTLKERGNDKLVMLDGDALKNIVSDSTVGYSYEARLKRAWKYSNLCKVLVDQGIDVIICTIAMFDNVREWNRKYVENYVEVFLDVPENILKERNKKKLYETDKQEVAGVDVSVEFPKTPDIWIKNNDNISVVECVKIILNHKIRVQDTYKRDTEYWNRYYEARKQTEQIEPSLFAEYVVSGNYLEEGAAIMELGCGNGRDSLFFLKNGMNVIGIDASSVAIDGLKARKLKSGEFICDDFVGSSILYQREMDACYSRFTLHSITDNQEDILLENVYHVLKPGGFFFVEARSIHDDLYGKGELISEHAYRYHDHYRRFIDKDNLCLKLQKYGFEIVENNEDRGFAPYGEEDPVLLRVICKKTKIHC